jgi:hypothetical protein
MRLRSLAVAAVALAGTFAFSAAANASPVLTGGYTASYIFPDDGAVFTSSDLTVGVTTSCPGADAICSATFAEPTTILASGLSITLHEDGGSSYTSAAFNGLEFSNLVFSDGSHITGFNLVTDLPGLSSSNVSFTGNSIEYNGQGDVFDNAYTVTLNLITNTSSSTAPVPEPVTLSLFGAGLVGAAALRRRKKAKA